MLALKTLSSQPQRYPLVKTSLGNPGPLTQSADEHVGYRGYSIGVAIGSRCEGSVSIQSPVDVYDVSQSSLSNSGSIGGSAYFWRVKRVADVVVSLLLLPVFAFFALALLLINPKLNRGPLFFHQKRMGQDLVPFTAIKFRSMQPAAAITRSVDDPIEAHRIETRSAGSFARPGSTNCPRSSTSCAAR